MEKIGKIKNFNFFLKKCLTNQFPCGIIKVYSRESAKQIKRKEDKKMTKATMRDLRRGYTVHYEKRVVNGEIHTIMIKTPLSVSLGCENPKAVYTK